jgi:glycosyltransferase involved in cell wall biosynthesis
MNIWLVTIGEPLPIGDSKDRLFRTGILANTLVSKGHHVTWWTSTFDHARKKQRFHQDTTIELNPHYQIRLLYSFGYRKNVSLKRIISHYILGWKFDKLIQDESKPHLILCSLPTAELCLAATKYGKKAHIPVVLDMRDMWPDIFYSVVPKWSHSLMRLFISPMAKTASKACSGATAITGITSDFVDWGVKYAGRERTELDQDFPMGYSEAAPSEESIKQAKIFWKNLIGETPGFIVCFFGAIGHQIEMDTIVGAASKLKEGSWPIRFIICGKGDKLDYGKKKAQGLDNIIFPGWVGAPEIWTLMRMSAVGLLPNKSSLDFCASIPNKPIEYLSAGLPVVSSLKGIMKDLLARYECGVTYENNDINGLVASLTGLFENPEKLKLMAKNASSLFTEKFVAEKVYGRMVNYLESIVNLEAGDSL